MEKSTFTPEHTVFIKLLRETRQTAGLTQAQVADRLRTTQSIVSKWERGELRLDLVQVQAACRALGTTLATFAREFDRRTLALRRSGQGRR
jgi:transcriptional regulator with XRE-family HTH domain